MVGAFGEYRTLITNTSDELEDEMDMIEAPLSCGDSREDLEHLAKRIHHGRDNERYYEAMERAQQLQKHTGELEMATPQSGLGGSHELIDLLEYLADKTCFAEVPFHEAQWQ